MQAAATPKGKPKTTQEYIQKMQSSLKEKGKADQIIQWGESRLEHIEEKDSQELLFLLGKAYSQKTNFKKAVFYYTKALQVNANAEIYYELAREYYRIDSLRQSLLFAKKALDYDPQKPQILNLVGSIELKLGNAEAAEKLLDSGPELPLSEVEEPLHQSILRHYLQDHDYPKAIELAQKMIQRGQKGHFEYESLGIALLRLNRYQEALKMLETSRSMHPMAHDLELPSFEEKKRQLGDIDQKIEDLEKQIATDGTLRQDSNHHFDLGFLYFYNGHYKKALNYFQTALDLRIKTS